MVQELPASVKACLWSYDVDHIDLSNSDHRTRVIENVLNRGTLDSVKWLFANISREDIENVIQHSKASDWNKKSLSLWSLVFGVHPLAASRFA